MELMDLPSLSLAHPTIRCKRERVVEPPTESIPDAHEERHGFHALASKLKLNQVSACVREKICEEYEIVPLRCPLADEEDSIPRPIVCAGE